ncbi:MAG: vWA domain-containing protein, partial [Sciscionella sp.]
TFLRALRELDLSNPSALYWAGRATLCAGYDDIPTYDRLFTQWFGTAPQGSPQASGAEKPRTARTAALSPPPGRDTDETEPDPALRVAAQDAEILRHRDLAELTEAERAHLRALLSELDARPPMRRSTRQTPRKRGNPDPGRTLRRILRTGGELHHIQRRDKRRTERRLVLLIDVSGSMSPYAESLLRFAHVVTRRAPHSTETFTFGTRLSRVSTALRCRDPELALAAAGASVPDWAGGTRIGETIKAFCDRWGHRGMARRAVIVVFSDGWERGDTGLLAEQMRRLARLASTVLWVNPHAGRSGYVPVQSGIAAALPHVDKLLGGHTLATLDNLLREVRDA